MDGFVQRIYLQIVTAALRLAVDGARSVPVRAVHSQTNAVATQNLTVLRMRAVDSVACARHLCAI